MPKIRIIPIDGNVQKLDGGSMYGNAPRPVWEKWSTPDHLGRIDLSCRAMLIQVNNLNLLCETGIGAFFEPKLAERYGVQNADRHILLENLVHANCPESDIHYVILSHLHFDHAGGLLPPYSEHIKDKKKLLFSNAKYIVGKEAWMRAKQPHPRDRASFIPEIIEALEDSGRLIIIEGSKDLPNELRGILDFYISHGHTPGQMLTIVKGESRNIVFTGDLVPASPWLHVPITMGYDRYPEMLIDEKKALYASLRTQKDILFFTHDTQMAAATFAVDEKGKYIVATSFSNSQAFEI